MDEDSIVSRIEPAMTERTIVPLFAVVGITVLYSILLFLGVFGNILVVLSILKKSELRQSIFLLFLPLALADFLLILNVAPNDLFQVWNHAKMWDNFICHAWPYVTETCLAVSSVILIAVAAEKFSVVWWTNSFSSLSSHRNRRRAVLSAVTWIVVILVHVPYLFLYTTSSSIQDGGGGCAIVEEVKTEHLEIILHIRVTLLYFTPLLLVMTMYSLALYKNCNAEDIKLVGVLLFLYFLLVFPARYVMSVFDDEMSVKELFFGELKGGRSLLEHALFCVNASFKPVHYYCASSKYRAAFKRVLCCSRGSSHSEMEMSGKTLSSSTEL